MKIRKISVMPSCFCPTFKMLIEIPDGHNDEEYIDELLDGILNNDLRFNCEWDFAD